MTKSELIEMLKEVKDNDTIRFESIIESGRGLVGDGQCSVDLIEDESEFADFVIHVSGDEGGESGFYE